MVFEKMMGKIERTEEIAICLDNPEIRGWYCGFIKESDPDYITIVIEKMKPFPFNKQIKIPKVPAKQVYSFSSGSFDNIKTIKCFPGSWGYTRWLDQLGNVLGEKIRSLDTALKKQRKDLEFERSISEIEKLGKDEREMEKFKEFNKLLSKNREEKTDEDEI